MNSLMIIRPELLQFTAEQMRWLCPLFWIFGGAILGLILCMFPKVDFRWPILAVTVVACIGGIISSLGLLPMGSTQLFNQMLIIDRFGGFFNILFMAAALFTTLISFRYLDSEKLHHPEYYILMLFSVMGMMLMTASLDLIVLFIGLELMSLTVYTLVGYRRADRKSNEASIKYFVLGGAASAVLLYGVALIYGVTASTNLNQVASYVQGSAGQLSPLFVLGSWLVVVGFLFKVAAVPFHMWMPDVYEGAPAPITAFMTTGLKAASFATFVRVFSMMGFGRGISEVLQAHVHDLLWVCAVVTMIVGNVIALTQVNLKRMLAYSSIAHTGYLLVGIIAGLTQGFAPVVMYLVAYSVMNLGAFAVLTILSEQRDEGLCLHDLSGLSRKNPWLAFAMALFMFSMAGIPPTAGFISKYLMFYSAIQSRENVLVVISVLCSAVSVYYYLRVLVYMYMREPAQEGRTHRVPLLAGLAVASLAFVTLQVGLLPSNLVEAARRAIFGA